MNSSYKLRNLILKFVNPVATACLRVISCVFIEWKNLKGQKVVGITA